MTVAEAQAQHGMFFHLWILADRCAQANEDDDPRRNAAYQVRSYCADRMQETFAALAPTV